MGGIGGTGGKGGTGGAEDAGRSDAAADAAGGAGGALSQDGSAGGIGNDSGSDGGTAKCAALYVMLDKTGSMTIEGDTATKWQTAITALNTFVNDPQSGNIYMALQYFSTDNYANDCTGAVYTTPEVPMGRLPDNAGAISASLSATIPNGFTPTEPALRGAIEFCKVFQQDTVNNPDKMKCVAVLVTDGEPNVCATDPATLVRIAADGYNNDGVMTFTVGMYGADITLLDQIAQAGNGDCTPDPTDTTWACNVSAGGTTVIDALNTIRGSVATLNFAACGK